MAITDTNTTVVEEDEVSPETTSAEAEVNVSDELLVEEISIDGMCGVY